MAQRMTADVTKVDKKPRTAPGTVVGPNQKGEKFVYAKYSGSAAPSGSWVFPKTDASGFLEVGSFTVSTTRTGAGTAAAVPPAGQTVAYVTDGQYTWIKIAGNVSATTTASSGAANIGQTVVMATADNTCNTTTSVTAGTPVIGTALQTVGAGASFTMKLNITHLPFDMA